MTSRSMTLLEELRKFAVDAPEAQRRLLEWMSRAELLAFDAAIKGLSGEGAGDGTVDGGDSHS